MTKPIKLSHSACQKYQECSEKWRLYYQEKLRSTTIGSALFFGTAMDDALGRICLEKKKELTDAEKMLMNKDEFETFESSFSTVYINGEYIDIAKSELADYFASDYEPNFINEEIVTKIIEFADELGFDINLSSQITDFMDECKQIQKNKKSLDNETKKLYNYICWNSLLVKGKCMLTAYREQVLPEIEEVFSIQESVSLPDGSDEFIGYIDLMCSFVDESGVKYVVDHKTSSRPYKEDSVVTSDQLAAYSEYAEIDKCAYIVLNKKVYKREPIIRTQIIKDVMPEEQKDITFDKVTEVFHGIREGKFEQNLDGCFSYGRKCDYFNYCREKSLKGLKDVRKK